MAKVERELRRLCARDRQPRAAARRETRVSCRSVHAARPSNRLRTG